VVIGKPKKDSLLLGTLIVPQTLDPARPPVHHMVKIQKSAPSIPYSGPELPRNSTRREHNTQLFLSATRFFERPKYPVHLRKQ